MFGLGNTAEVKQQQHQDNLRRVEQERLAQETVANQEKLAVLQSIGNRLFGLVDKKQQDHQTGTKWFADESTY